MPTNSIPKADLLNAISLASAVYTATPSLSTYLRDTSLSGVPTNTEGGLASYLPDAENAYFLGGLYNGGAQIQPAEVVTKLTSFLPLSEDPTSEILEDIQFGQSTTPAQATAFQDENDTLYLALRGTDNVFDAVIGGQAYTAEGQSEYFNMLMPFFEAARAYALDQGLERVVVSGHSLGGSMTDLFALLLKPQWEADFEVFTVSMASSGVVPGAIELLAQDVGLSEEQTPVPAAGGSYAQPDNHLNISNTDDPVPFPTRADVGISEFSVPSALIGNVPIAGALLLDQTAVDGTQVPIIDISPTGFVSTAQSLLGLFQGASAFGPEHSEALYTTSMQELLAVQTFDDISTLSGRGALVGGDDADELALSTSSFDIAVGRAGNDLLSGAALNDTLIGGSGDDTLIGSAGNDFLNGGEDTDTVSFVFAVADAEVTTTVDGFQITHANGSSQVIAVEQFEFADAVLSVADMQARATTEEEQTLIAEAVGGMFSGGSGNDTLITGSGVDIFDGAAGRDTAVYDGPQANFRATLNDDGSISLQANAGGSIDRLSNVEVISFSDAEVDLEEFVSAAQLSTADFTLLAEMYAAYFNRAPDATGLYFWADKLAEGVTLPEIAAYFFDQDETRAIYDTAVDDDAFVTAVYANVLGRVPDQAGFDFWTAQLEAGTVTEGTFVLEIINGAKNGGSPDDVAYLSAKTTLGLYYAATFGMSDTAGAAAVFETFGDAQTQDITAAKSQVEALNAAALADGQVFTFAYGAFDGGAGLTFEPAGAAFFTEDFETLGLGDLPSASRIVYSGVGADQQGVVAEGGNQFLQLNGRTNFDANVYQTLPFDDLPEQMEFSIRMRVDSVADPFANGIISPAWFGGETSKQLGAIAFKGQGAVADLYKGGFTVDANSGALVFHTLAADTQSALLHEVSFDTWIDLRVSLDFEAGTTDVWVDEDYIGQTTARFLDLAMLSASSSYWSEEAGMSYTANNATNTTIGFDDLVFTMT